MIIVNKGRLSLSELWLGLSVSVRSDFIFPKPSRAQRTQNSFVCHSTRDPGITGRAGGAPLKKRRTVTGLDLIKADNTIAVVVAEVDSSLKFLLRVPHSLRFWQRVRSVNLIACLANEHYVPSQSVSRLPAACLFSASVISPSAPAP
jgi:hypothetical protein